MNNFQFPTSSLNQVRYPDFLINGIVFNPSCWQYINLPTCNRNVYIPQRSVLQRSIEESETYRTSKSIEVSGNFVPKPVQNFEEVNFHPYIYRSLKRAGFAEPTPIQAQSWPIALSGRDMIGVAITGSGKTLAYLLPALSQVLYQRQFVEKRFPLVLILAPTRELAIQIHSILQEFSCNLSIRAVCVYGGINVEKQLRKIGTKGVDIVVATPGRLMHFMSINAINLHFCNYVVIDEADLMLDMGFIPQVCRILSETRRDRQTLMFSATFPVAAQPLALEFLTNHIHVSVGTVNRKIFQMILVCEEDEKKDMLFHLLREIQSERKKQTLLFVRNKKNALMLTEFLQVCGFSVQGFHSGRKQKVRERILKAFRRGEISTLVTTDVASRGLDIEEIRFVINYDFPRAVSIYVHRIGRTARGNKTGTAYTFFTKKDWSLAAELIKVLNETNNRVPSDLLKEPEPEPVRAKKRKRH